MHQKKGLIFLNFNADLRVEVSKRFLDNGKGESAYYMLMLFTGPDH